MLPILKSLVTILCAFAGILTPALADQFRTIGDSGTVEGYASSLDITRISLVGDRIASVKKADADEFGDDFNVAHDTITGDVYLTLPAIFEQTHLNFFITSQKGFTYKVHLAIRDTPSTQIFVQNPGVGSERAESWELETPFRQTVVRLIRAMWNGATVEGYEVRQNVDLSQKAGPLTYRVTASYDGASLVGRILKIENSADTALALSEDAFFSPGVIAVAATLQELPPRGTAFVFVVARKGAA